MKGNSGIFPGMGCETKLEAVRLFSWLNVVTRESIEIVSLCILKYIVSLIV